MITAEALETALRASLPAHMHAGVAALAAALADLANSGPGAAPTQTPEIARLLEALAGKQVGAGQAVLSFGAGSQVGEVQVQELAGNNITKLTINVYHERGPGQGVAGAGPTQAPRGPARPDRVRLHEILAQHFNNQELDDLCYRMSIDPENFSASGKEGKARELILYTERRGRYDDLVSLVLALRPHLRDVR